MHNVLRVAGILALAVGLFMTYDGFSASGTSSSNTSGTFTSTTTSSIVTTGTDSSTTTVVVTITSTIACITTNYPPNQVVVTITTSTFTCTYAASSTTTTPNYVGSLMVDKTSAPVGATFHFSGFVTNNGQAAGGQVLYLKSGSSIIAVNTANANGSFDFYQTFGSAAPYTIFVLLPDGHTTNSIGISVTSYVPTPTVDATSASLLSSPRVYWDVLGLPPNKPITLTVTNVPTGATFQVATAITNAQGAASGSFAATKAMVGTDQLTVTNSSPVSTYFTVSSGYTYAQSILGVSGSGIYAEAITGLILTLGGILLVARGSRKKSL